MFIDNLMTDTHYSSHILYTVLCLLYMDLIYMFLDCRSTQRVRANATQKGSGPSDLEIEPTVTQKVKQCVGYKCAQPINL